MGKKKKVFKFKKNGELVDSFETITEAAESIGVKKETISAVVNGKRQTAGGFLWSFNNNIETVDSEEEKEWRDIKGFEGRYQMALDREVRKLPFEITQKTSSGKEYTRRFCGSIVKQSVDAEGYYRVSLDGKSYRTHWLFYNTFIGDSSGYIIDHIDRNRLNNDPSNLRLLTPELSIKNRTLPYRPDIIDVSKYHKYRNKEQAHPYLLRFSEDGKRKAIGYYSTYEEAENKYRELYNERQNRIDASSKVFAIDN